jgi:regulator of replication initiation timing
MDRSEKDWAASYINSKKDGNKLVGDIVFTNNPLTSWLYEEIERAPKEVQLSIDIRAIVEDMDTPDGRTGRKVSKVLAYRSTDFVSYAAAGGEALNVFNSMIKKEIDSINEKLKLTKENTKMDITLAKLKAENPELITELKKEFENGNQVTDLQNSLNAVNTKLTGLEAQVATLTADKATLSLTIETLQNEKKTIETDRDGLKLKLDEIETTQKVAKWKSDIQNAITESKIDSKLVTAVFLEVLEKETDIEKVKTMIEDRKSIADPKFSIDNGGPAGDDKPVVITDESLIESIKS